MNKRIGLILVVFTCMLCGCALQPKPRLAQYIPSEYESFLRGGTGSIEGQAFLVTMGGDVKVGAGREVRLNPVTTFSNEWYARAVLHGENLEPAPDAVPPSHTTIADGDGRFRFGGLAAGDYYLMCNIFWAVNENRVTGGAAHAKVHVDEGKVTNAVVTR
ncbi:MAG: hypothetical protein IPK69_11875 [Phycisphaerales bacterium]|nr:MAG: hypothetical protein IPK69_11875 [Phycisphaerales bacterium]